MAKIWLTATVKFSPKSGRTIDYPLTKIRLSILGQGFECWHSNLFKLVSPNSLFIFVLLLQLIHIWLIIHSVLPNVIRNGMNLPESCQTKHWYPNDFSVFLVKPFWKRQFPPDILDRLVLDSCLTTGLQTDKLLNRLNTHWSHLVNNLWD